MSVPWEGGQMPPQPAPPSRSETWTRNGLQGKILFLGYHEICISCKLCRGQTTLSLGFLGVSCGIHMCPKKNFHQGENLINVVYLSFVLSAKSALMTQAVCSSETIIFLYLLQPWGFSLRERMSGTERQTFLVLLLRLFFLFPWNARFYFLTSFQSWRIISYCSRTRPQLQVQKTRQTLSKLFYKGVIVCHCGVCGRRDIKIVMITS